MSQIQVGIASIRELARGVSGFALEPLGGGALPPIGAGAHIDVFIPNGLVRQYSITNPHSSSKGYSIAIKRDSNSRGGSAFLHDHIRVGDTLRISMPRNSFALCEDAPSSILIAGGIGITPILAMGERLHEIRREWSLHYAGRNRCEMAFLDRLAAFGCVDISVDEEQDNRLLDIEGIVARAPADAHFYCCGPTGMLKAFEAATAGWPGAQIHSESFAPPELPASAAGFTVELRRSRLELFVPPGESILDVVRKAGVMAPYSCEQGICGSCETTVLAGAPIHRDQVLSPEERAESRTMMICCSGSLGDRLVLDL